MPPGRWRGTTWAVAGLTLLAAALRFPTLDVQSFYLDEAFTVAITSFPDLPGAIGTVADTESTPPLYYVLVWLWEKPFGSGEAGLRSLSALVGTATVPVVHLAGARLAGARTGLVAAALVAVSPFLVWYSQEARAYALLVFLSALSLLAFARVLERPGGRRELWWWAGACALLLLTHYFAVFLVAAEALWLLTQDRHRRRALPACAALGALAAGIGAFALAQGAGPRTAWIGAIPLGERIVKGTKWFVTGIPGAPGQALGALAFGLVAAAAWLLLRRAEPAARRRIAPVAAIAAFALGVPLVLAIVGVDYLYARNLIAAWPALALLAGAGLAAAGAPRAGPVAAVALCAVLAAVTLSVPFRPEVQRSDWRGVAAALGNPPADRAIAVVPTFNYLPLRVYRRQARAITGPSNPLHELVVVAGRADLDRLAPLPPPPGFERVERRDVQGLAYVRFHADRPARVHPGSVVERWAEAVGLGYAAVLVEQPE